MGKLRLNQFYVTVLSFLLFFLGGGCGGGTVGSNPPVKALVGTVANQNGQPVSNSQVVITEPNSPTVTANTDAQGDFAAQTNFAANATQAEIKVVVNGVTSTAVKVAVSAPGANVLSVILEYNSDTTVLTVKDSQFSSNESSPKTEDSGDNADPLANGDSNSNSNGSGNQDSKDKKPPAKPGPSDNPNNGESDPDPAPPPEASPVQEYQTLSAIIGAKDVDTQQAAEFSGEFIISFQNGNNVKLSDAQGGFKDVSFPKREDESRYVPLQVTYYDSEGKEVLSEKVDVPWMPTSESWGANGKPTTIRIGFVLLLSHGVPVDIGIRWLGDVPGSGGGSQTTPEIVTPPTSPRPEEGSDPSTGPDISAPSTPSDLPESSVEPSEPKAPKATDPRLL